MTTILFREKQNGVLTLVFKILPRWELPFRWATSPNLIVIISEKCKMNSPHTGCVNLHDVRSTKLDCARMMRLKKHLLMEEAESKFYIITFIFFYPKCLWVVRRIRIEALVEGPSADWPHGPDIPSHSLWLRGHEWDLRSAELPSHLSEWNNHYGGERGRTNLSLCEIFHNGCQQPTRREIKFFLTHEWLVFL
jgi:hypothetical protein